MIHNELSIDSKIVFKTVELKTGDRYEITWNEIITVVKWQVKDRLKWILDTFESSVYYTWNIEASEDSLITVFNIEDRDMLLNKINVEKEFWDFCRNNWKQLRELYDVEWFEKVDLYRWNQIDYEFAWEKYKFNLWFCWKEVDCLFHNQHNFTEIHTNIVWDWYMQKALTWNNDWKDELIENVWLLPWSSHKTFNIKWEQEENWNPKYPFHRWLWWTTWNIWLVVEKY